jgi:FlaA1/EpsC-like NDP-sugar epimerase
VAAESRRLVVKFLLDLSLWTAAGVLAFLLRLDGRLGPIRVVLLYALLGLPIRSALIHRFGLYRQAWRKIGVRDLVDVLKAVGAGTVLEFSLGLVLHANGGFPRSAPVITGALAVLEMGGARMMLRLWNEQRGASSLGGGAKRVLVVGAGDAGTMLVREMQRHPQAGLAPIGFLDDDAVKRRHRHVGLNVLGAIDDLPGAVREARADEVLIAIPSAPGEVVRRVVDLARAADVRFRILPGVFEILAGRVDLSGIRDVQVEDLLRREPIAFGTAEVAAYLEGRVVLVTGAGGSIGSELVRQIAPFDPAKVVLLGRGENSLFDLDREMDARWPRLGRRVAVGNVCDPEKMRDLFERFAPQVVFHTAAHKHVPFMEYDPDEAVLNNVGGTKTLAETALRFGVERFVNVSTDKAVNPRSMMGASKRIAECLVQALSAEAGPRQAFMSVRFGNVLGSRGSVVPVFQEQIRNGGPVTLTHPDMTRYLMTIPEASQLVVEAGALAQNGAVYVLDMGEPVRMLDLARDLIQLSGHRPDEDIQIVFTGIRPGEKIHEEMFAPDERPVRTRHEKILAAHSLGFSGDGSLAMVDDLLDAARVRDEDRLFEVLARIVPSYEPTVPGEVAPVVIEVQR